jgi:hypothetical protein
MVPSLTAEEKFDLAIVLGAFIALVWILYVNPLTGELLGLALGGLPILGGVVLFVEPSEYVVQTVAGLLAVALGGAAPATILYRTPAGNWLVGSQPLPLALGVMLLVVLVTFIGRRYIQQSIHSNTAQPAR